jgi:hypothetical protein
MEGYNLSHFDNEKIIDLNNKLERIILRERKLVLLLDDFILSSNGHTQRQGHDSLLHLLVKVSLNFDAVNFITPLLRNDYRFKTSVNLIYRSVVDDIINLLYLMGFSIPDTENQISLENELNISHRDFMESTLKIIDAQANINKQANEFLQSNFYDEIDINRARDELFTANPNIFNIDKKTWKTNSEIRVTSDEYFKRYFVDLKLNQGKLISATKKIDLIKMQNYPHCDILTSLNKYYTQYFHFSPRMHDLVLNDIEFDIQCYLLTIVETLTVLGIANKILKKEKDFEDAINIQLKSFLN